MLRCVFMIGLVLLALIATFFGSGVVFGAGSEAVPKFIDLYSTALKFVGLSYKAAPLLSGFLALCVLFVLGVSYRVYVERALANHNEAPSGRFSLVSLLEFCLEYLDQLGRELFGRPWVSGISLMCTLFLFILVMNLSGLVPFFPPGSGDFSANLGMGLAVFLVYNIAGVQEHGWKSYLRHFAGPKVPIPVIGLLLPVLIFVIEMISHGFRPVSLSLRLMGNIFGDHMLVGVFTGMVYWVVPSVLLFFGVLVSIVQAFVFSLLSGIYLALAISHDH